jgi:hypothetical protein
MGNGCCPLCGGPLDLLPEALPPKMRCPECDITLDAPWSSSTPAPTGEVLATEVFSLASAKPSSPNFDVPADSQADNQPADTDVPLNVEGWLRRDFRKTMIRWFPKQGPTGIGGWLILPAIGCVLGPLATFGRIGEFKNAIELIGASPRVIEALQFCQMLLWISLIGQAITAFLFFTRNQYAPGLWILTAWWGVLSTAIAWTRGLAEPEAIFVHGILVAIWTAYFVRSKRVKNTFIYPLPRLGF